MTSEAFRPRLPLDPFTAIDHDIPWSIPHYIPLSHTQTILILGEPAFLDLVPLLTSTYLSRSLVLFATYNPPHIPANTRGPALRILRLAKPLAVHDAGAIRLVSLLERAQRVAHLRPRDSFPHTIQLSQPSPDGDFSVIERVSYAYPIDKVVTRRYPSPTPTSDSVSSSTRRRSGLPLHNKLHRTKPPPKISDEKAPFDAIINFLPHGLPDKALLKHAILVTTLSAPFVAPPTYISTKADWKTSSSHSPTSLHSIPSPSHSYSSTSFPSSGSTPNTSPCSSPPPRRFSKLASLRAKNRLSLLFQAAPLPEASNISQIAEGSWKAKNAHLVHVLPPSWSPDSGTESDKGDRHALSSSSRSRTGGPSHSAGYIKTPSRTGGTSKPKLVQSIEQFLLSFAYPLGSLASAPSSNLNERPKPALILSSTREKEHALLRASTSHTPFSNSNLSNLDTPLKPAPYLLAPGVFGNYLLGSDRAVQSACSLPDEDDPEQNRNQDTRGDAYMDIYADPEAMALTIGEIILLGALDFDHTRPGTGNGNGRAWIGNVADVVVADGSPDPDSSSRKAGVGKGKEREVAGVNAKMMKITNRNGNGLPTPPESSSSNNSAEGVEEQRGEEMFMHARPISPASSTPSPIHRDGTPNTRSKVSKRQSSSTSPSAPASTILNSKQGNNNNTSEKIMDENPNKISDSLFSPSPPSPPPTPASIISKSNQRNNNNTPDKIKDKNSNKTLDSLSSPSRTSPTVPLLPPVQLPALVIHHDRARSPRGSEDNYDLGLGHGVPVPPMIVSKKPSSRSASSSGLGSATLLLQTQGDNDTRSKSAYGETRRSSKKKGSERKDFVGALRNMGWWWKDGSGKSVDVSLKA